MSGYQRLSPGDGSQVQDLSGEDASIRGFRTNGLKLGLYYFLNLAFLGIPSLLGTWCKNWKVSFTCDTCSLHVADFVLVTDENDEKTVCKVKTEAVESMPDEFSSQSVINRPLGHQDSRSRLCDPENCRPVYRYFTFQHEKYIWDDQNDGFRRISGISDISCQQISEDFRGMCPSRRKQLMRIYGRNEIDVEIKSYFKLLVEEVLNPFYIFQVFSIVLWSFDEYIYYGICVAVISCLSIAVSLYKTRKQSETLRDMAQDGGDVVACVRTPTAGDDAIGCKDLVPGDVILLPPEGCIMPCDAVLIQGSCIVNESMLTGESVPVNKSAIVASRDIFSCDSHKRHVVFGGTHVIQPRFYAGHKVACVVVRTGFSTLKGQLIRSILFPKEVCFKFYTDAMKFVFLLTIVAFIGMIYCIKLYVERKSTWYVIIVRVLDIITIVVPPALPAAMTVGTLNAQSRLRAKQIFCISPQRINFCGKLKLVCFDKTGTLTEEGLSLSCIVPVDTNENGTEEFLEPVSDPQQLPINSRLLRGMASCHSLTHIKGNIVGDTLDIKMFESTGFVLEEPLDENDEARFNLLTPNVVKNGDIEIGIIREFDFTPQLQRMAVIVKCLDTSETLAFCKGAPEKIRPLCKNVPENYDKILDWFTVKGYRVLGLGWKKIDGISWHQLQKASRESIESDLYFGGFLVMQNSLKPATIPVISELNSAAIRSVMVTGDNMLTALSVARECGMIPSQDKVVIISVTDDGRLVYKLASQHYETLDEDEQEKPNTSGLSNNNGEGGSDSREVEFRGQGTVVRQLSKRFSTESNASDTQIDMDKMKPFGAEVLKDSNYHFALTGKTWECLQNSCSESETQKILVKGCVFARMSPECKMQLVEAYQALGYIVAMCGDGANDCSALSVAHVGISLSEAEASVAAPFTSKVADISCVPTLILEGRCALVTSFGIFKYMALYSMVQFASVLILYTHLTNLADTQFLWIDLAITMTVTVAMGRTRPVAKLVSKRPMSSLVSFSNVFSIFTQILICVSVQLAGMKLLTSQEWFTPVKPATNDELVTRCWETTTIFTLSSFQYLITSVVFSKGPPFRKPFYNNYILLGATLFLTVGTALLMAYPLPALANFFELEPISAETQRFRFLLLILPVVNFFASAITEYFLADSKFVKRIGRKFWKKGPKTQYKEILENLQNDHSWPPVTA